MNNKKEFILKERINPLVLKAIDMNNEPKQVNANNIGK